MTTIHIPPAALEAGARRVALLLDWDDWETMHEADRELCRVIARAAFVAMVSNWPGMATIKEDDRVTVAAVYLPLPQETHND